MEYWQLLVAKTSKRLKSKQANLHTKGSDERLSCLRYVAGAILCHERLSIMDLESGKKPIKGTHENYVIYNEKSIITNLLGIT